MSVLRRIGISLFLLLGITISLLIYRHYKEAQADQILISTIPSSQKIKNDIARCTPATSPIVSHIIGLSDPYMLDQSVRDFVSKLDIHWVRANFNWNLIDTGGTYQWSPYDGMVDNFSQKNIHVLGLISDIPSPYIDWQMIEINYERFLPALIDRYESKGVHYWEIFNEPNLPGYGWLITSSDARKYIPAYIDMLALSNKIIRSHDPSAVIVLGGLSSSGYAAGDFLQAVYAAGAKECFDIIAFHPYGLNTHFVEAATKIRSIEAAYGDSGKPVWFNEYGTTDDANRATLLRETWQEKSTADALFWFSVKDFGFDTYGLVRTNNSEKPEFQLFKNLVEGK